MIWMPTFLVAAPRVIGMARFRSGQAAAHTRSPAAGSTLRSLQLSLQLLYPLLQLVYPLL